MPRKNSKARKIHRGPSGDARREEISFLSPHHCFKWKRRGGWTHKYGDRSVQNEEPSDSAA